MKDKLNNSSDFDLDLFIPNGILICHFATAGLQIQDEIFFDGFHNEFRNRIKNYDFIKPFKFIVNPSLDEIISSKYEANKEFNKENYLKDFINYAEMGLFSFDRTNINSQYDTEFHLVAYPVLDEEYRMFIHGITGRFVDMNFDELNAIIDLQVQENLNKSFNYPL